MDFYQYEALFSRLFSSFSFPFFIGERQGEAFLPEPFEDAAKLMSFAFLDETKGSHLSASPFLEKQDAPFLFSLQDAFPRQLFSDPKDQKESPSLLFLDAPSSFSSFPFLQKDESRQITQNHTFSPNISVNATLSDQGTAQELISLIEDQLYRELLAMSEGGR